MTAPPTRTRTAPHPAPRKPAERIAASPLTPRTSAMPTARRSAALGWAGPVAAAVRTVIRKRRALTARGSATRPLALTGSAGVAPPGQERRT
jgi:hypothetical protein